MNWKLRLKNKATLAALLAAAIAFVYQVCSILGIVPPIAEDAIVQGVAIVLNILVALGVLVDPTTAGIGDSEQAMEYDEPRGCNGSD